MSSKERLEGKKREREEKRETKREGIDKYL